MHCSCNMCGFHSTTHSGVRSHFLIFLNWLQVLPAPAWPAGNAIPLMELPVSVACGIQAQGMGTCSGEEAACPPVALLPLPALQRGWGLQHLLGTPETPQL